MHGPTLGIAVVIRRIRRWVPSPLGPTQRRRLVRQTHPRPFVVRLELTRAREEPTVTGSVTRVSELAAWTCADDDLRNCRRTSGQKGNENALKLAHEIPVAL